MEFFYNGIKLGFALSLLVGPILFTLLQTSVEQGFRAGWAVCLGIWTSDALFILATYFGVSYVIAFTQWHGFQTTLGVGGGIILILFGLFSLLAQPPRQSLEGCHLPRYSSYFSLWLKGFLINSCNPFSFFFWLGITTVLFSGEKPMPVEEAPLFYTGLVGTLVVTDSLKIALAKVIRRWLKPKYVVIFNKATGVILMICGVVLFARTFQL
ncbi:MAG: LysE family translocator, partial [Bacteroidota bacterium]